MSTEDTMAGAVPIPLTPSTLPRQPRLKGIQSPLGPQPVEPVTARKRAWNTGVVSRPERRRQT